MRAVLILTALVWSLGLAQRTAAQDLGVAPPHADASPLVDGKPAAPRRTMERKVRETVQRLTERLHPIEDRLRDDHRLRTAERVLGLGAVAYGVLHARPQVPLTFAGTQALRFGLARELDAIRERSGFAVAPSVGRRSFVVTFSRRID